MPRHGPGVVTDLQSLPIEAVGELDVLPRGRGEGRVERALPEELAIDGDVRGVEEVERDHGAVFDQLVAELQAVVVDVVHERRHARSLWPAGVAEAGHERVVVCLAMNPRMLGQEAPLRHSVVADEDDEASRRQRHPVIASRTRSAVGLGAEDEAPRSPLADDPRRLVRRAVIDDDHLEPGRIFLLFQCVEHAQEHVEPVVGRDDDRQVGRRHRAADCRLPLPIEPRSIESRASWSQPAARA